MPPATESTSDDPFDTLLNLEDTLYTTAYTHGVHDGARAGRIEGRIFGLEKGFEKYSAMGVLHGRALVWNARLAQSQLKTPDPHLDSAAGGAQQEVSVVEAEKNQDEIKTILPPLQANLRLQKNIHLLTHLTDPYTFSTENSEEGVADFDDRFKRAGAKAKIIEKTIGETSSSTAADGEGKQGAKSPGRNVVRGMKVVGEGTGKKDDSIEDFAGSRFLE